MGTSMFKKFVRKANYFADPDLAYSMVGLIRNIISGNALALRLIILGLFLIIFSNNSYADRTSITLLLKYKGIEIDDINILSIWDEKYQKWKLISDN